MHRDRVIVFGLSLVGVVAAFLPWFHAPLIGAVTGMQGHGKFSLAVFLFVLVLAVLGEQKEPLATTTRVLSLVPTAGVGLAGLWKILDLEGKVSHAPTHGVFAAMARSAGVDVGLYLTVGVGLAIALFTALAPERSAEASTQASSSEPGASDSGAVDSPARGRRRRVKRDGR